MKNSLARSFLAAFALACAVSLFAQPVHALEPIVIGDDQEKIEITLLGELYEGRGDRLELDTAVGMDGIAGRIAVSATTAGTNPNWVAFALTNPTNNRIERWLTVDRYSIIGSGVMWPDLDTVHIAQVTPSMGFRPKQLESDSADIFPIELGPRETITYVVELQSQKFPRLYLWKARAYEDSLRASSLFNGIMLGIAGLLAVFLTSVFVANHKAIFPVTALIAWSVAAYLCVDFGFWHKLFRLSPDNNALYRAATEASIALSVVIFLYTFLRIALWHAWIRLGFLVWILGQAALIGFAVVDANLASGFARLSFLPIAGIGTFLIIYLAVHGQDRALSLVPSWLLFLVWLFGAAVTILGQLSGDIVVSALLSGLVLVVLLLGFTVTQFAFRSSEPLAGAPPSQLQVRSMAIDGAGASIWEWNGRRDEVSVSENIDTALGLPPGSLSGRTDYWMDHLHPADKERFRLILWSIQEKNEGKIHMDFRLRRSDSSYLWYELRAHSVPLNQYRTLRCVGLLRDITNQKRSQERLMHDAVHDSLTGLPNRELFMDRLAAAIIRAREEGGTHPTVLFIDIDRFKNVNSSLGLVVGDSMLLTVARRLSRHLSPLDALARVGGDQFAILIAAETEPRQIGMLAERVRRSLRSPMKIAGKEVILTGSIGIAVFDGKQDAEADILREAEMAMYRAKRSGTDRVEIFKPSMREEGDDRLTKESDLRRAIDRRQLKVLFQPIVRLEDEAIAGFEALLRWDHPRLGRLNPDDFIPIAEETGIIFELGAFVLDQAMRQAVRWQKAMPRPDDDPLYVSVNISSKQIFRHDLIQNVRTVMRRDAVPPGTLRLEVTESLVMENPEAGIEILDWLKSAGARLSMDDFGTGYSSLSYLQRFPFDTIKIDKSLIRDSGDEGAGPTIVRSIVALSHELEKEVVAEGIETLEDTIFLRSIGCEYAQGYYFGEPMSEKDVLGLLSAVAKTKKKGSELKLQKKRKAAAPPADKTLLADQASALSAPKAPDAPTNILPAPASPAGPGGSTQAPDHTPQNLSSPPAHKPPPLKEDLGPTDEPVQSKVKAPTEVA